MFACPKWVSDVKNVLAIILSLVKPMGIEPTTSEHILALPQGFEPRLQRSERCGLPLAEGRIFTGQRPKHF